MSFSIGLSVDQARLMTEGLQGSGAGEAKASAVYSRLQAVTAWKQQKSAEGIVFDQEEAEVDGTTTGTIRCQEVDLTHKPREKPKLEPVKRHVRAIISKKQKNNAKPNGRNKDPTKCKNWVEQRAKTKQRIGHSRTTEQWF